MTILKKCVGQNPVLQEVKNGIQTMEEVVGGVIKTVTMPIKNGEMSIVLVCNKEGQQINLDHNFNMFGQDYFGNVFFCGAVDNNFCSYPYDLALSKVIFRELWGKLDEADK